MRRDPNYTIDNTVYPLRFDMHINNLIDQFCQHSKHLRGVSDTTIARYTDKISFFASRMNLTEISEVTEPLVIQFFLSGRMDRKWKATTYHTYYMSLKVFFRWCVKNNYLQENYVLNLELPRIPKNLIPKALKKEAAARVLETAYNYPYGQEVLSFLRARNHAILATFIFTGLRKSELLGLRFTDVNFEEGLVYVHGKGDKKRAVPIPSALESSLTRYLKERNKAGKTCPEFFTSSKRNCGFSESGLRKMVDLIRKASGVYFAPHVLRHTFGTQMGMGGCDIYTLSKFMGHSSIETTTIYMGLFTEHARNQITKHPLNDLNC